MNGGVINFESHAQHAPAHRAFPPSHSSPCCPPLPSKQQQIHGPTLLTPHLTHLPHAQAERCKRNTERKAVDKVGAPVYSGKKTKVLSYSTLPVYLLSIITFCVTCPFSFLPQIATQDDFFYLFKAVTLAFVVDVHLLDSRCGVRSRLQGKCHHMAMVRVH